MDKSDHQQAENVTSVPNVPPGLKSKRGRPKWEPPELKKVEWLASRGLSQAQIAAAFGISPDTLIARKKDFSGFSEAIKRGQIKGLTEIANTLYQQAHEGNVAATIFFLKNRDPERWNDRRECHHQDAPTKYQK